MSQLIEVTRVVRRLAAAPVNLLDQALNDALGQLNETFNFARSWLFFAVPSDSGTFLYHFRAGSEVGKVEGLERFGLQWVLSGDGQDPLGMAQNFLQQLGAKEGRGFLLEGGGFWLIEAACEKLAALSDDIQEIGALLCEVADLRGSYNQLTQSSARLQATLNALPDLIFEIDSNGCYTDFYSGPRNLMAVSPEAFVGQSLVSVLPPAMADVASEAVRRVMEEGKVSNIRFELDLEDGRHVFLISGALKQPLGDGEPTAVFIVHEASEIYAMQDELNRLGSITRAMNNLVVIVDQDFKVTWVNPAFEVQSGWSAHEIIGHDFGALVRCDATDPAVSDALVHALRAGLPYSGQTINADRYGRKYYVDFNAMPLFSATGEPQGFVSVETDVTSMKEQEFAMERLAFAASEAQIRLHNALDALGDGMVIFDNEGQLLICNAALRASFPKLGRHAAPGTDLRLFTRQFASLYLGADIADAEDLTLARLSAMMAGTGGQEDLNETQCVDGRWFRIVVNRASDGGLIALFVETTVRRGQMAAIDMANMRLKRALSQQAEAEQRLHRIMDSTRVGTWELDLDIGTVTVCRQWGQILGVEADGAYSISHRDFLDMVHPEDRHLLETPEPQGPTSDVMFEQQFRMRHRSGDWIWMQSRGKILRWDSDRRPVQFVGVDLDISEQKRLEAEVRRSSAYLNTAIESNVAAFAIFDKDDILLHCNSEARRLLDLSPGAFYGRVVGGGAVGEDARGWRLVGLDGRTLEMGMGPCEMARRGGSLVRGMHLAVLWDDGRRIVLTCNATLVDPKDRNSNCVLSFWDITEELNATEQLRKALAHAEEMSRAKSVFLANMSHEIRTPLNGVLGLAEVLSMQLTNPEHVRMISTIRQSGETLLSVLNSVLDMSKIEAGKMELEAIPFILQDSLRQIETVYSIQADERDLEFDVITSTGGELPRIGDPYRIQQVLHNLLSNAFKFSSEGDSVTLSVACRAGRPVVFEVRDTGVGMTAEQSARVFRSFEQADGSTTRRFGGTGLGLSIVRELVLLMGGEIEIESALGEGTLVRVVLPLEMQPLLVN